MRVFIALRPPAQAIEHLAAALRLAGIGAGSEADFGPGAGGPPSLRPTAQQNLHITLAFLGEIPDGAVDPLAQALAAELAAGASALAGGSAALAGAGVFQGRTLWVGVRETTIGPLARAAERAAEAVGLRLPEDRPRFRAHMTVARLSSRGPHRGARERQRREDRRRVRSGLGPQPLDPGLAAQLDPLSGPAQALAVYVGPQFPVDEVGIYASYLGEGPGSGARHELLHLLPLAPPGAGGEDYAPGRWSV